MPIIEYDVLDVEFAYNRGVYFEDFGGNILKQEAF